MALETVGLAGGLSPAHNILREFPQTQLVTIELDLALADVLDTFDRKAPKDEQTAATQNPLITIPKPVIGRARKA
jgi:hypothetical protein